MAERGETGQICRATITLNNRHGLHARPAHLFVQAANAYASDLAVWRHDAGDSGDEQPPEGAVDGKSIMGVMMLAAEQGTVLELRSEGPDCVEQVRAIEELVAANFGEE